MRGELAVVGGGVKTDGLHATDGGNTPVEPRESGKDKCGAAKVSLRDRYRRPVLVVRLLELPFFLLGDRGSAFPEWKALPFQALIES